ncbi:MAG: hypothetical protein U5J83_12835 [Bryobacterales bacterium]|nr:hypothetical protein [Bryobacterales bacterium]
MPLLNETLSYPEAATSLSRSIFLGGSPEAKEPLPSGTRLFRFARVAYTATPCEWWMLFDDFVLQDRRVIGGFSSFLYHSGCRIGPNGNFLPVGEISLGCADPGSRLVLVQLNTPVYAFLGASTVQRPDPCEPGLSQRGGEFRVWIPGIGARMMNTVSVPRQFLAEAPEAKEEDAPAIAEEAAAPE